VDKLSQRVALTGNEAVAQAMRQINPDVVAAYPITPQTDIVQYFSQYVADGRVKTEFVTVESEHSAMSATIGASAAGSRAMTATSSQGLALMWEMIYIAASFRLPIVMPVVNRTLSGPINIHCDHSDSMGARDSGCIQLYSETAQEAYDNTLMALKIAEDPRVMLPVMVMQDGFITSHSLENLYIEDDAAVASWAGDYKPEHPLLDIRHPLSIGGLDMAEYFYEHKMSQIEAIYNAGVVVDEVSRAFEKRFGRKYSHFDSYMLDDAEIAIVILNSAAGTARPVIDALRKDGIKAGLLKPRMFRPFPAEELAAALKHVKALAICDRAESFSGNGGPLFSEVRSALYSVPVRPLTAGYVYGLGGRNFGPKAVKQVFDELSIIAKTGHVKKTITHLGVRE
jgi:pyruvate ferredoxin oxidoreductase alpha subunit